MIHVSWTHPVDLDFFFCRINLDLGIQIKYVKTNLHIADILTKGSFSRERWSQLSQSHHTCTLAAILRFFFRLCKATVTSQTGSRNPLLKVPLFSSGWCAAFQPALRWKRTTRKTMLLAWNTLPGDRSWWQNHATTMRIGKFCCQRRRVNPCTYCRRQPRPTVKRATSATHERGVHNVRSHDGHPAHKRRRRSSERRRRSFTERETWNSVRCGFSSRHSQWIKQFGASSWTNVCEQCYILAKMMRNHAVSWNIIKYAKSRPFFETVQCKNNWPI